MHSKRDVVTPFVCLVLCMAALVYFVDQHGTSIAFWLPSCIPGLDCLEIYLKFKMSTKDPDLLEVAREHISDPLPDADKTGIDIYKPVWRKLVDWYMIQESIISIFHDKPPGTFVEVGAVDGLFMSQTLYVEKNLSWTGLLIEPNPKSFALLKKSGRNAKYCDLCVYPGVPSMRKFWIRRVNHDLPEYFVQLQMARSKLLEDAVIGENELGFITHVTCFPLSIILRAAEITSVDLLTAATGVEDDQKRIRDVLLSRTFAPKVVVIQFSSNDLLQEPYPYIRGYLLSMLHSQMVVKVYFKKSECIFLKKECEGMKVFDTIYACHHYRCLGDILVAAP